MTTLTFPSTLSTGDLQLDLPQDLLNEVPNDAGARRLTAKAAFLLERTGAGALRIVVDETAGNERDVVDVTVVPSGSDLRVVGGSLTAVTTADALAMLRPKGLEVAAAGGVALTPDGIEFRKAWPRQAQTLTTSYVVSRGAFRPSPHGLFTLLQKAASDVAWLTIEGGASPDWNAWRELRLEAGKQSAGEWMAAFPAIVNVDLGQRRRSGGGVLKLRIDRVVWDGTSLRLIEIVDRGNPDAAGPNLTLQPEGDDWKVVTSDVSLTPVAVDFDQTAVRSAERFWLRGAARTWFGLEVGRRSSAVTTESRPVVLHEATVNDGEAPLLSVEMLPDNCGRLEVALQHAETWTGEVRAYRPGIRLSIIGAAHDGRSLAEADRPPCDHADTPPTDSVWVSSHLLRGDARGDAVLAVSAGVWQLKIDERVGVQHYRRMDVPIDTPPAWSVNDRAAGRSPSPLRGLVPFDRQGALTLDLQRGGVETSSPMRPSAVGEPNRPSYGLDAEQLGVELASVSEGNVNGRFRHAVAALDEMYRTVRNDVGLTKQTSLNATHVSKRYAAGKISVDYTNLRTVREPAPQVVTPTALAGWAPPVSHEVVDSEGVRLLTLIVERYEGTGEIRRWGTVGETSIAGVTLAAVSLVRTDEYSFTLALQSTSPADVRTPTGVIVLALRASAANTSLVATIADESVIVVDAAAVTTATASRLVRVEATGLRLANGKLYGRQLCAWHGAEPAMSSLELPGFTLSISATAPRVSIAKAQPDVTRQDVTCEVTDGQITRLLQRHALPTLQLLEFIVRQDGTKAFELREISQAETSVAAVIDAEIDRIGHRVLICWAGKQEFSAAETTLLPGVTVSAMTRVFLELGRLDRGRLEIIGGMLGWEGAKLFGLAPSAGTNTQPFPHVTVTWPSREPTPGNKTSQARLELNGTWQFNHATEPLEHRMAVHLWDASIPLLSDRIGGTLSLSDKGDDRRFDALVHHSLPKPGHPSAKLQGFAFHQARVDKVDEKNLIDLSALLYVEASGVRQAQTHVGGMKRRALMGFLIDHEPPQRTHASDPAAASCLLRLRCGPIWGKGFVLQSDEKKVFGQVLPLAWAEGVRQMRGEGEGWRVYDPEVAAPGATAAAQLIGATPAVLSLLASDLLISTLVNASAENFWLPCPIRKEEKLRSAPPRDRLWIIGSDGLEELHSFARSGKATASLDDLITSGVALLLRSGWHREAVLERWEITSEDAVATWTLLDSRLLNRSVSLARFAGDTDALVANVTRATSATTVANLTIRRSPAKPQIGVASGRPHVTIERTKENVVGGVTVYREVPFEYDRSGTLYPHEGPLSIPLGIVRPATSVATGPNWRSMAPDDLWIESSSPRPGELGGLGINLWGRDEKQESDENAIWLSGGVAREERAARWAEATLRVHSLKREKGSTFDSITFDVVTWRVEPLRDGRAAEAISLGPTGLVLVQGPEVRSVHPRDPISVWAFAGTAAPGAEMTPLPAAMLMFTQLPEAWAGATVTVRAELYGKQPDEAVEIIEGTHRLDALTSTGIQLFPSRPPGIARGVATIRLAADVELSVSKTATLRIDGAPTPIEFDVNASRGTAARGLVGIMAAVEDEVPFMAAFGPEPATRWRPVEIDGASVRWVATARWEDWRGVAEPSRVSAIFYLEPSGVRSATQLTPDD